MIFYRPHSNEVEVFETAARNNLPVLLKGPTGCGKSRFVRYMAEKLGRPLITVACAFKKALRFGVRQIISVK